MVGREAITVRFPEELLGMARETKAEGESFNDLVVKAVEREVSCRRGLKAHELIVATRQQIKARTGAHPDPVPLIRQLREGQQRRG